jgi:hypothetical protein
MKINMNTKNAATVAKNNDGSHNLHILDYDNIYFKAENFESEDRKHYDSMLEKVLHTGRRFVTVYGENGNIIAEDPVMIFRLGEDSLVYAAKNFEIVNPEDAATSKNAVVVALNAEDPQDLVYFAQHSAQEMSDAEKLEIYQECIYHSPEFAQAICKSRAKDFGKAPAAELQTVDESWLHYGKLDVFNVPVLGVDDSFPCCTMVVPAMYLN